MCFVGFLFFFFSKEISKLCQTHLDQRPQQERRGDGAGRKRGKEGERPLHVSRKRNSNTFVWKPQAKNAFIRTQATEPDSNSSLYRNIQRRSRRTRRAHAPRVHTHAHPHTPRQRPTTEAIIKRNGNQTLKTLQKKWNTSSVRINKNLHKTRHILWVRNGGNRKTRHWIPTENPTRTSHVPSTQRKGKYCATLRMSLPQDTQLSII